MTRPGGEWRNWARSERVRPRRVEFPTSVEAVRRAVQAAGERSLRLKAVGAGHSFTGIAVAPDILVDLREVRGLVGVDRERGRATLRAGTTLREIPALLRAHGLAMTNLGDIDRQTIAGALATGTHGTGAGFGGLATQVVGMTLITADGEVLRVDDGENPELLPAVALSLGALGVIVEVTLQCVPTFRLQAVERPEPLEAVLDDLAERSRADHFEFYWFPGTAVASTKTNTRRPASTPRRPVPPLRRWIDETVLANGVYRATCAAAVVVPPLVTPINGIASRTFTDRTFTDASHRVFTQRRAVRFREMEYAVPVERLAPAFRALRELVAEREWRISFPVEVRVAASDDRWMSTAHARPSGYIAVHRYWREDPTEYFGEVERIMLAHEGRPHWGKEHSLDAGALRPRYPRFDDFVRLRERLDPTRMFANAYLDRVLGE